MKLNYFIIELTTNGQILKQIQISDRQFLAGERRNFERMVTFCVGNNFF